MPYPNADRLHWIDYAAPGQEPPRGLESLDWCAVDDVIELPVAWDLDMFYLLGGDHAESALGAWVTPGFVEALGIRPAIGRGFDDGAFSRGGEHVAIISHRLWTTQFSDGLGSEPAAVVSESLARQLWPAGDAVGRRVSVPREQAGGGTIAVPRRVVGIVRDVLQDPADQERADLYVPVRQAPTRFALLLVRTAGAPAAAVPAILDAARDVDPELVVHRARPLQAIVDEATARPRFMTSLLGFFSLTAAVLALVGVYGVIAYAVRQREREIAVRLAVGADPARIVRPFVRQGGAILLAIWWPARRAASTDPAIACRSSTPPRVSRSTSRRACRSRTR